MAIIANQMKQDDIDLNKIAEKYGNNVRQLANWMKSLVITDYGYKYLKKEGYSDDQIADWVKRTPAEKMRMVRTKSSPETLTENLLREGETLTEDVRLSHENGENVRLSDENGEKREKGEDETLRVPQPEGNKGTVSNEGSQVSPLTFSHNPQVRLSDPHNPQVRLSGENDFSQVSHISQLSPQQLSQLGMFRDGKGDYFHFSNTEDGGYHLSPATQESVAAAVAGVQRQAQRAQSQQSDLMKKISENAVDQFQVNIQAIVRKVALSPTYTWGSRIYRSKLNTCTCFKNCYYTRNSTHSSMQQCDL